VLPTTVNKTTDSAQARTSLLDCIFAQESTFPLHFGSIEGHVSLQIARQNYFADLARDRANYAQA